MVRAPGDPRLQHLRRERDELVRDREHEEVGHLAGVLADREADLAAEEEGEEVGALHGGGALRGGLGGAEADLGADDDGHVAGGLDAHDRGLGRRGLRREGERGAQRADRLLEDAVVGGAPAGRLVGGRAAAAREGQDAPREGRGAHAALVDEDLREVTGAEHRDEQVVPGALQAELPGVRLDAQAHDGAALGAAREAGEGVREIGERGAHAHARLGGAEQLRAPLFGGGGGGARGGAARGGEHAGIGGAETERLRESAERHPIGLDGCLGAWSDEEQAGHPSGDARQASART